MSLAAQYTGKTCIGDLVKGLVHGEKKEVLLYNICDHEACYKEVESQAIAYTAGVPPAAAAMLIAEGVWDCRITSYNVCYTKLLRIFFIPALIPEKGRNFQEGIFFYHSLVCLIQYLTSIF